MNNKIEEALKDQDIMNIMHKAASSFRRQLNEDEVYTCQINALWKAILNYDPEKGSKFTTYLYSGVRIECIREVKFKKRQHQPLHANIADNRDPFLEVDIIDEVNNCSETDLVLDRMASMTIKEIAEKHQCNRETVRRKIKKCTKQLAKRLC